MGGSAFFNAKCKMQNYKVKLTFFGSAGRAVKCKMQNAKFCANTLQLTFIVSAGRALAVPDRMREQLSG